MPVTEQPNIAYPIGLLDVGDSFFIPAIERGAQQRIVRKLAKELGIEVACYSGIDVTTGLYGIRVVRIK